MGTLDDMAQFDYSNGIYSQRQISDVLGINNQKNSGSKIYPGFYEQMHSKRKDTFANQMQGVLPHTCFSQGVSHPSF